MSVNDFIIIIIIKQTGHVGVSWKVMVLKIPPNDRVMPCNWLPINPTSAVENGWMEFVKKTLKE